MKRKLRKFSAVILAALVITTLIPVSSMFTAYAQEIDYAPGSNVDTQEITLDEVQLTLTPPVALSSSSTPLDIAPALGSHFIAEASGWVGTDGSYEPPVFTFAVGNTYKCWITLKADDGYYIPNDVAAKVYGADSWEVTDVYNDPVSGYSAMVIEAVVKASAIDIKEATVSGLSAKTYTGKALTQKPVVKYGNTKLAANEDYTVSFSKNVYAGTAKVTITGKGNYTGTKTATFKINPAKNTLTVKAKAVTVKSSGGKIEKNSTVKHAKAVSVSNNKGKLTYKLVSVAKTKFKKYFAVNATNGNITVKKDLKKGNYTLKIKVTAAGNKNYKSGAKTVSVKVTVR